MHEPNWIAIVGIWAATVPIYILLSMWDEKKNTVLWSNIKPTFLGLFLSISFALLLLADTLVYSFVR